MAKYRQGRLSEEIKKSVSGFLINGAKDPALTSRIISITGAEVTRDGIEYGKIVAKLLDAAEVI